MMGFLSGKKKIIAAVVGVVCGLAISFGCDGTVITEVSGAVVACISVVTYIIAEGKIDVARITQAAVEVQEALEELESEEKARNKRWEKN